VPTTAPAEQQRLRAPGGGGLRRLVAAGLAAARELQCGLRSRLIPTASRSCAPHDGTRCTASRTGSSPACPVPLGQPRRAPAAVWPPGRPTSGREPGLVRSVAAALRLQPYGLPPQCRSMPCCRPLPSTIARPRPEVASSEARHGCGTRLLPSVTSTRTCTASTATRTTNSVRACSTAFVVSSFAAISSVSASSLPSSSPSRSCSACRRNRRACDTAGASGSNSWLSSAAVTTSTCPGRPHRHAVRQQGWS
jgi:hypothetical protein